jgi:hypothetical protein
LFVGQIEIHGVLGFYPVLAGLEPAISRIGESAGAGAEEMTASPALRTGHNPNIAFAMMFLWISFDPP